MTKTARSYNFMINTTIADCFLLYLFLFKKQTLFYSTYKTILEIV